MTENSKLGASASAFVLLICVQFAPLHAATVQSVNPYDSAADSPFNSAAYAYFYLEDFEDGLLNTPGVTASTGGVTSVVFGPNIHDSVDLDDGVFGSFPFPRCLSRYSASQRFRRSSRMRSSSTEAGSTVILIFRAPATPASASSSMPRCSAACRLSPVSSGPMALSEPM